MKIREYRLQLGLTQDELAKCMGVKQSTVSIWETGASMPPMKTILKLAGVLNCTLGELIGHERKAEAD